jgi:hypothetical protein
MTMREREETIGESFNQEKKDSEKEKVNLG